MSNRRRQYENKITYDKDKIRKGIVYLTYNEARRVRGPIYEVLIKELYEDSCLKTACYFEFFFKKENDYYRQHVIRDRLSDERPVLLAMVEHLKMAEKFIYINSMRTDGISKAFHAFDQCLEVLRPHSQKFDWVFKSLYEIVALQCEDLEGREAGADEITARIYYKYARYLDEEHKDLTKAHKYIEKALVLCRGKRWDTNKVLNIKDNLLMHQEVAIKFCIIVLEIGEKLKNSKPKQAVKLAHRGVLAIAEVGKEDNLYYYCNAYIHKARFLMESGEPDAALKELRKIKKEICKASPDDYAILKCDLLLVKSICYTNLNLPERAVVLLQETLKLSRLHNLKIVEANVLLNLGKAYAKYYGKDYLAKQSFHQAGQLFLELGDKQNHQLANYLLAKLKFNYLRPLLLSLVESENEQSCELYRLRQWKNRCEPYWTEDWKHIEKDKCLLHEAEK